MPNNPNADDGSYYAEAGYVWKSPIRKANPGGGASYTLGFRVCKMMPEVGAKAAEVVAELMNTGHAALEGVSADAE